MSCVPHWQCRNSELLLANVHRLVECIGHKQNSLHAPLPTEPILEIYDKEEKQELGEGDWEKWGYSVEWSLELCMKMCCDITDAKHAKTSLKVKTKMCYGKDLRLFINVWNISIWKYVRKYVRFCRSYKASDPWRCYFQIRMLVACPLHRVSALSQVDIVTSALPSVKGY